MSDAQGPFSGFTPGPPPAAPAKRTRKTAATSKPEPKKRRKARKVAVAKPDLLTTLTAFSRLANEEIVALIAIMKALQPLDARAKTRVLNALAAI